MMTNESRRTADDALWDRLCSGMEGDLETAADRRRALEDLEIDTTELEAKVLEKVRDWRKTMGADRSSRSILERDTPLAEGDEFVPTKRERPVASTTTRESGPHPDGVVITEVRVNPRRQGRLRALCSVTLGGVFVIRGIKVIEGPSRLFLAMPSRKEGDGKFRDVCHPVSTAFRASLEDRVIAEYSRSVRSDGFREEGASLAY